MVNSDRISKALQSHLNQNYNWVLPNFYYGNYEMDVFCLNTKSMFLTEFEIKVSKADFKKDFKKGNTNWNRELFNQTGVGKSVYYSKHFDLQNGNCAPNKFIFVVPEGLITVDEVPEYAGLYYYTKIGSIHQIKTPKFLRKEKIKDSVYQLIADRCYWRYKNLLFDFKRIRHDFNNLERKLRDTEFEDHNYPEPLFRKELLQELAQDLDCNTILN